MTGANGSGRALLLWPRARAARAARHSRRLGCAAHANRRVAAARAPQGKSQARKILWYGNWAASIADAMMAVGGLGDDRWRYERGATLYRATVDAYFRRARGGADGRCMLCARPACPPPRHPTRNLRARRSTPAGGQASMPAPLSAPTPHTPTRRYGKDKASKGRMFGECTETLRDVYHTLVRTGGRGGAGVWAHAHLDTPRVAMRPAATCCAPRACTLTAAAPRPRAAVWPGQPHPVS